MRWICPRCLGAARVALPRLSVHFLHARVAQGVAAWRDAWLLEHVATHGTYQPGGHLVHEHYAVALRGVVKHGIRASDTKLLQNHF